MTMHPVPFAALPLVLMLSAPLGVAAQATQSEEPGIEGRRIAEAIFGSMDPTARGHVTMGDIEIFRDSVFAGMDANDDKRVSYTEFASWDPGFARIATDLGRSEAYVTASKIVFAFWDRDGDDHLTEREFRTAMAHDFRRADLDDDAVLTQAEFIAGFPVIVAMRAAIRPDL